MSQVRLDPVVAQNVVSYVTIIDVPNRDLKLKPGMTATVTVEVARADDVVRVPNAALRFRPTQEMLPQVAQAASREQSNATSTGRRNRRCGAWRASQQMNPSRGCGPCRTANCCRARAHRDQRRHDDGGCGR